MVKNLFSILIKMLDFDDFYQKRVFLGGRKKRKKGVFFGLFIFGEKGRKTQNYRKVVIPVHGPKSHFFVFFCEKTWEKIVFVISLFIFVKK